MILRQNCQIAGYTDLDLNKKLRNKWLHQERLKKADREKLEQLKLKNYNTSIENIQQDNEIQLDQNCVPIENLRYNQEQNDIDNKNLDIIQNPIVLNKFHEIMQEKQNDNQSQNLNCTQRKIKKENNDNQSIVSDNISQISISESKFGDILTKNNLQQQDIKVLIKDNFPYFKHFLGYCICFKCDCGMCRCAYMKKEQKKIKFRGAYISLYNQDYKHKSLNSSDSFKGCNKNLFKNHKFEQFMDHTFDNTDKITATPAKTKYIQDLSHMSKSRYNIPLFDLTTNRQSYQKLPPLTVQDQIIQHEKLPTWINYNEPINTIYNQDFLRSNQKKQHNLKQPDQNLFPAIPSQRSQYQNQYKNPNYKQEKDYTNINKKSTIGQLESNNQVITSTSRDTYKKPNPQECQEESDHKIKQIIFKQVDQLLQENNRSKKQDDQKSQQNYLQQHLQQ